MKEDDMIQVTCPDCGHFENINAKVFTKVDGKIKYFCSSCKTINTKVEGDIKYFCSECKTINKKIIGGKRNDEQEVF